LQQTPRAFLLNTTPLFEEEGDVFGFGLIANVDMVPNAMRAARMKYMTMFELRETLSMRIGQ
jgi:hypothetical protein